MNARLKKWLAWIDPTRVLGLGLTALLSLSFLAGIPFVDLLELKTYDLRVQATSSGELPRHVAVVAIDDRSLAEVGRWPWRRLAMAELVQRVGEAGASAVALGVLFGEPENGALIDEVERLELPGLSPEGRAQMLLTLSTDGFLAEAIRAQGRVVLPVALVDGGGDAAAPLPVPSLVGADALPVRLVLEGTDARLRWDGERPTLPVVNLDEMQSQAAAVGHINVRPDIDGTVRRVTLALPLGEQWVASADLLAAALKAGARSIDLQADRHGLSGVALGARRIETDERATALVRYYGPAGTVPTLSAADVLTGRADLSVLKGRVVLIGPTATGIDNPAPAPFGSRLSGIEIRATTVENLVEGRLLTRPRWIRIAEFGLLLLLGATLSLALSRLGILSSIAVCLPVLGALVWASVWLFQRDLVFEVVYPLTLVLALFVLTAAARYIRTSREKREISAAFQYYVPSKVVDEITRDITKLRLGGEKRELSVLFSDIRGFTSIAEGMAPEDLVQLLTAYLTQMTDKVFLHDGLLDKYIGDAVMAVYGAPIHRPDHAVLACRTALDMMAALRDLQVQWKASGSPLLDIGIGINTGPMIVGNMGSKTRFDYTVIGDAVNLGSRIESMNKTYGTSILISESTYQAVRDEFKNVRQVDVSVIRGRAGRVGLYELMPPGSYPELDWLPEYERAYRLYQVGSPAEATAIFEFLHRQTQDPVSAYYLERIRAGAAFGVGN